MEKRYRVLRFISFIYKLLAILILIGTIVGAVLMFLGSRGTIPGVTLPPTPTFATPGPEATPPAVGDIVNPTTLTPSNSLSSLAAPGGIGLLGFAAIFYALGPIGLLIWGILTALGLYAVGDFISLLVATEQNTRAGAEYNRQAALMMREVAKRLGGGTGSLGGR